jgi:DNA repair photolyase
MERARGADADDARHGVLARTRPVGQRELDAFLPGRQRAPRPRGNRRFTVVEVEARSALTVCRMGEEPWSLNPFMGCSHDCVYCYVPDVAHVERARWGSYVALKRNLPNLLAKELKRKEPRPVFLSSATDPYQPVEAAARITRRCLELLLQAGWPVRILTRNPLILRDLDILTRFDDIEVGMSVPTLDEAARRIVEPGAPPVAARLRALRALADAGLRPTANLAPCYPLSGGVRPDDVARSFQQAGVCSVYWAPWRYLPGVRPALAARVLGSAYEIFSNAIEDEGYMDRLYRSLHGAFRRAGVPLDPVMERLAQKGPRPIGTAVAAAPVLSATAVPRLDDCTPGHASSVAGATPGPVVLPA